MKIYKLYKTLWDMFAIKKTEKTEIRPLTFPKYFIFSFGAEWFAFECFLQIFAPIKF